MKHLYEHDGDLTEEQARVLSALVTYPTKTAAAKALGMSRPTLWRRMQDPDLREAYEAVRKSMSDDAIDTAISLVEDALLVLHRNATDPDVPPSVQVMAAGKLVDSYKSLGLEIREIRERLEALEAEL